MEITSGVKVGQVVRSKAGRDKGNIFLVVDIIDDKYVKVVDGDKRRVDSPKKKKMKHLAVFKTVVDEYIKKVNNKEKVSNGFIRKILQPLK